MEQALKFASNGIDEFDCREGALLQSSGFRSSRFMVIALQALPRCRADRFDGFAVPVNENHRPAFASAKLFGSLRKIGAQRLSLSL